jgi:uncharacterized membrane protein YtjA (UPF0391 family)
MPAKLAAVLAVAGVVCILLSTLFGVSRLSDWLLDGAQALFVLAVVIFTAYIFSGIIRDARAT